MFDYLNGVVTEVYPNSIALDVNNVGYLIYTSNPYSYELNNTYKIYMYNSYNENENILYGFKNKDDRTLFVKLISVKGLGAKTANGMFATGSASGIIDAIDRENILYLKKFPKIGEKLARQIILDLKGKLVKGDSTDNTNEDLVLSLEALGYKMPDIKKVIAQVNSTLKIEEQIKEALRLLLK